MRPAELDEPCRLLRREPAVREWLAFCVRVRTRARAGIMQVTLDGETAQMLICKTGPLSCSLLPRARELQCFS